MKNPTAGPAPLAAPGQAMVRKGVGGKRLRKEQKENTMLGIDVSKDTLACALLDPRTRRALWRRSLPNTPAGIQALLGAAPADAPWILEPTGRYSTPMAAQAVAAGRRALLAPPRHAQSFLRSVQCRAKTDKLDSEGLALFALSRPLDPYPLKTPMQEQMDQLLSARTGLARAAASLGQQVQELPYAKEALGKARAEIKAQIKALDAQIKALDAQIAALTDSPEMAAAARLRQVPGVGPVPGAALASRLSGKKFSHPDQLVAYVGLDIGVSQSGRSKGEWGLTKQGDAELRRLLYLCASASLRATGSPFRAQYERERAKGLATTAALCAVARKLAKVCWSMVQHGTDFDPARVYQQPKPKEGPKREAKDSQNAPSALDSKP